MAETWVLSAAPRVAGRARRDRAEGWVPAVMYGHGMPTEALRVEERALTTLLHRGGAHHLLQLQIADEPSPRAVVIKEIQHHPVSRRVLHVDFQAVAAGEQIHAEVPLRLSGEEQVARAGGILQVSLHAVRVSCLPQDLPEYLEVPVGHLHPGQSVTVGELQLPAAVRVQNEPDEVILHVLAQRGTGESSAASGSSAG